MVDVETTDGRSRRAEGPTPGQGPHVTPVVQDEVKSLGRVHDGADACDAGELQQSVGNASAAATRQPLQRLHQQVQTLKLQEVKHPGGVAGLQAAPQARVVDRRGDLRGHGDVRPGSMLTLTRS